MYSTKEAELIYYRKNLVDTSIEKIGTKEKLIILIAETVESYYSLKPKYWSFNAFWEQNISGKDGGKEYYGIKKFQYFNSKKNIVDIRSFREEAVEYIKKYGKPYKSSYRKRIGQNKKIHSGLWCINKKTYSHMRDVRKMSDEKMKPFNSRKDKNRINGWNRNYYRLCSCNWKDQTKDKKQWMHKAKAKDCKTIRTWMFEA